MGNRYSAIIGSRYEEETVRLSLRPAWRSYWPALMTALIVPILSMGSDWSSAGWTSAAVLLILIAIHRYRYLYTVTSHRAIVRRGLIARDTDEVEVRHTREYKVRQGLIERILNYGDVAISSAAGPGSEVVFRGVVAPHDLKEAIRGVRNGG